jgi:hypothetical protein
MTRLSTAEKRDLLIEYERHQTMRLARKVFSKPKPPLWMILMPVFFVFFAFKMKEYKNDMKSFADNWMLTRERCLDMAYDAVVESSEPPLESIVAKVHDLPSEVMPHYRAWIEILTDYYRQLLAAEGADMQELVRSVFRSRSSYLLTQKQISSVEHVYHQALLPSLQGNKDDLAATVARIHETSATLQREQADLIFT